MTRSIIVVAKNLPSWWADVSRPRMEEYANKCGAELVVIEPERWDGMLTRQIVADHVCKFDRSLVLDADVVISREAPDIFEAHQTGFAWATSDSAQDDPKAYRQFQLIVSLQAVLGACGWTEGYANTGVVLCDREHAKLWTNWTPLPPGLCPDQANLNYRIRRTGRGFAPLGREWNAFGLNSVQDGGWPNRLELVPDICQGAHISHAAGFSEPGRGVVIRRMDVMLK